LNLDLTYTRTNPLLKRKEIGFIIHERLTPNRSSVRNELAVTLGVNTELVFVRNLTSRTGTRQTIGLAHIYEDSVQANKIEPKHIIERNKIIVSPEEKKEE
jgi:ribosomal protein S24E